MDSCALNSYEAGKVSEEIHEEKAQIATDLEELVPSKDSGLLDMYNFAVLLRNW